MGIKSNVDLSGTVVGGVTLGIPATSETGELHWDGGVPEGTVDDVGMFTALAGEGQTVADVPLTDVAVVVFPEWAQPEGGHDAYPVNVVVNHGDVQWVSLTADNVWEPGVSGWRRYSEDPNVVQPWVQPTGAHDAYALGAHVSHQGQTWESTIAANVWEPGVYGWIVT